MRLWGLIHCFITLTLSKVIELPPYKFLNEIVCIMVGILYSLGRVGLLDTCWRGSVACDAIEIDGLDRSIDSTIKKRIGSGEGENSACKH